jgi:GTP-binding protein
MNNIVAIVGRPNVGNRHFNRLIQRRDVVFSFGVTRDRNYGKSEWKEFSVIDTEDIRGSDVFLKNRKQVELAIDEADVIIFVVDVEEGITPMDDAVARLLRKVTKPVLLAVNKVDNAMREKDAIEFII